MVNIVMGPEGSGKTKLLIDAISRALKTESGSMVCIEKGHTLRYDVDHRVRLIDASEYSIQELYAAAGLSSGLHARVILILRIFSSTICIIFRAQGPVETENFLDWCNLFSAENGVAFTLRLPTAPAIRRSISHVIWTEIYEKRLPSGRWQALSVKDLVEFRPTGVK